MNETTEAVRPGGAHHQSHLDQAAHLAREAAHHARGIIRELPRDDKGKAIAQLALAVSNEAWDALGHLVQAGAVVPDFQKVKEAGEQRDAGSLAALAALADPEAEQLLAALEQAQAIAERIDARRGRVLPATIALQPGESRGTDLAESISTIAQRLRLEVYGPAGRD